MDIPKVIAFISKYSPYNDADKIKEIVERHILFKTCIVVYNNEKDKDIAAVCRWNMLPNGRIAHILDLIIHPDYRSKDYIQRILIKGLSLYPKARWLIWERENKHPGRKQQVVSIAAMLKDRRKINLDK